MRTAAAAIAYSMAHPTIPYDSISSIDGDSRTVGDLACARSVMADYDIMPISDMETANRMWERTAWKRSDTPWHGAPLCFPNARAGSSGHVALYDALSGLAWTTPIYGDNLPIKSPYQGKHLVSIPELARLCGNAYAGWGMDIAGVPINFTQNQENDMPKIIEVPNPNPALASNFYRVDGTTFLQYTNMDQVTSDELVFGARIGATRGQVDQIEATILRAVAQLPKPTGSSAPAVTDAQVTALGKQIAASITIPGGATGTQVQKIVTTAATSILAAIKALPKPPTTFTGK